LLDLGYDKMAAWILVFICFDCLYLKSFAEEM